MKRLPFLLIIALWSSTALAHSIGVFADPLGADCNLVVPYPGGAVTAYAVGDIDAGSPGILGTKFKIGGLPDGWTASATPDPASNLFLGHPFAEGAVLGYPSCVTGRRVLLTISITPASSVQNVGLFVVALPDPSNRGCGFEGRTCQVPCPLFCVCQVAGFGLDCSCVESMPATINGPPCLVNTEDWSWGKIKSTYK